MDRVEVDRRVLGGLGNGARAGDWRCGKCGAHNFKNKTECFGCNRVDNDWKCDECHENNFKSRSNCYGCGKPKGKVKNAKEWKDNNDWDCRKCGNDNFGSRNKCKKCGESKPTELMSDDWNCPKCTDYQFGKNKECRKCGTKKPNKTDKKECQVCCEELYITSGLECGKYHFVCKDCVEGDIGANGSTRINKKGELSCMCPDGANQCDSKFSADETAKIVSKESWDKVLDFIKQIQEKELNDEVEARMKIRLGGNLDKLIADRHISNITDKILNLSCPKCDQVFFDFNGCCSLECSKCNGYFCAWCLQTSGGNSQASHAHIAKCSEKPPGSDSFFASFETVQTEMKKLRVRRLTSYMNNLHENKDIVNRIKDTINPLLKDIVSSDYQL